MVHEIEDFYGVYLLYCLNPKFKGRTYIGYTVDPNRRIKQHNTGRHAGGAFKTSGRGPWEMVLIIHGFPNDVSGLRFEWAWQHPDKSRRLRGVPGKSRKESAFEYRWRVVCNMLRTAPWCGLSLTVRWLKQDFQRDFPAGLDPPLHMPVVFGPVVRKKAQNINNSKKKATGASLTSSQHAVLPASQKMPPDIQVMRGGDLILEETSDCALCYRQIQATDKTLSCLNPGCTMVAHIICLAQSFLSDLSLLLPVEGKCPRCQINLLWGELIRHKNSRHKNLSGPDLESGNNPQTETDAWEEWMTAVTRSDESS